MSCPGNRKYLLLRRRAIPLVVFLGVAFALSAGDTVSAHAASSDTQAPAAPAFVQVLSVHTTLIALGWPDATDDVGVAGYDIYENGTKIASTGANSASVSGLTCGTSYTLSVDAYDAAGNRSPATSVTASTNACSQTPDTQPPPAPASLQAMSVSASFVALGWGDTPDAAGIVGYDLYENGSILRETDATSASVSDLVCGTSYAFSVDAFNAAGIRSTSTSVTVSTSACPTNDAQPPTQPAWLKTNLVWATGVGLSWAVATDNVGVAGYDVYWNGSRVATTQADSASVGALTCGTSYSFAVDAYDAAGNRSPQTTITASTPACAAPPPSPPPPPAPPTTSGSIYWGAYIEGPQTYGYLYGGAWSSAPWCDPGTQCALDRFTQNAGKRPSIEHWGQGAPWDHPFDASTMSAVVNRGDIPALDMSTGSTSLKAIANGTYDASLQAWAQAAKQWGHPFFLVLDEEMNGTWYPYSPGVNGNTAADFVAAWRHMHDVFDSVGATNVTWVWCPNVDVNGNYPMNQLYPGDAYVDWTGLIGYNWGPAGDIWYSAYDLFSRSYANIVQLAPSKPIFIAEIGSVEDGGSKAAWITDLLTVQLPQNFPQIKALVWFNWRTNEKGQFWPWEFESSPSSQAAFESGIASSYYAPGGSFGNLPLLSKVQPPS